MSDAVIRVEGIGKRYRVGERESYRALRDVLSSAFRSNGKRASKDFIWAVRDVSFEVKQGEVVGLIGRNGAGKSTLLKLLARITRPTVGHAELHGRIASLLEVGTGFHPELTGRENIFLSGAILGMSKAEIVRKFDEIVAFSEVERFIDTPLKHYSSGMGMRLAFAVAAHLEPEILLVDEVLSVGDASFQKKCLGKMREVSRGGRTIIFVSHNMGAVTRLCSRALWLSGGQVLQEGLCNSIVTEYQACHSTPRAEWTPSSSNHSERDLIFQLVQVKGGDVCQKSQFSGDMDITVEIQYEVRRSLSRCQIGIRVYSAAGLAIFTSSDADQFGVSALPKKPGAYRTSFVIPGRLLAPGTYSLLLAAHSPGRDVYDLQEDTVVFEVMPSGSLSCVDGREGVIAPLLNWRTEEVEECDSTETKAL